ncbi:fukutin-like [Argonauta hians]
MKKPRLFKLLLALSVVFLLFQVFLIRIFWKRQDDNPETESDDVDFTFNDKQQTDQINLPKEDVARVFLSVCAELKVPVFLLDADILSGITSDKASPISTLSSSCQLSCRRYVTFGVNYKYWDSQGITQLLIGEFFIHSFKQADPRFRHDTIPTHFFLYPRDPGRHTIIQVVMFHLRLSTYFWHGAITPISRHNSILPPKVHANLVYSVHAGAYKKFELDEAVVDNMTVSIPQSTDQFLKQIPHSQFIECNATRARNFVSIHGVDNSESSQKFQRKARQVLAKTKRLLDSLEIRFWLSSGTCLGWFRQCGIIPHSKDVDIGIWIKDYDPQLIPTFQEGGFALKHMFGKVSDSFELSFAAGDIKLDIFFFYEDPTSMWNGGTQVKTGKKLKYIFPKFTLCWSEFLDLWIRVPCDTLSYITANYGKDWFTPIKEWDWKSSPSNVHDNGIWPEDEWDTVIQLF